LPPLLLTVGLQLLAGCALPSLDGRATMSSLSDTGNTRLGTAVTALAPADTGKSGIYPLPGDEDAFVARALLAAAAERSIDAQYYIWHGDVTGRLLLDALCKAADRGVRVRLLLDDNNTGGLDPTIATLAAHRNIFVRLFNPLVNRRARWTNYVFDFSRVNHRMHNKSFTVDGQVTIVGGRNVGDEYFAAGSEVAFADLDVVAVGPVVREVSQSFDTFWNSASAYPALMIVAGVSPETGAQRLAALAATSSEPAAKSYLEALQQSELVTALREHQLPLEWADVKLVVDDPRKVFAADRELLLLPRLLELTGRPDAQFDIISPYLVPGEQGTASLAALATRGVHIRVLTNSLASNDVAAVHAGYAKRRKPLLRAGLKLYELKPRGSGSERTTKHGSSAALHAKTFQIDGIQAFVGSFNFDLRSARLNTELGFVIDSPPLASRLRSFFDTAMPRLAYQVALDKDGELEWIETTPTGDKIHGTEPETSAWRRGSVHVLSVLPIEWLL
jgi:cardiolipin synthase C